MLRYTLCSAATRALNNKIFKKIFEEKLKNKGVNRANKSKLRIKYAEKLLRIAYAVLKTKKPFDLEMINQYSVKQPVLTNVVAS
ncbi:hypothetical protein HY745_12540 [Candidatus Desantisbacteria bacterium]|nr:hypothetical protein [Candidatus Desantisbacteria bacterium]